MITPFGTRSHGCRMSQVGWCGLDVVILENELLRVAVLPQKGADLLEFRHKPTDLDLFWHSPLAWPPQPWPWGQVFDLRGSFLDTFHGGWQVSIPNGFFPTSYLGAPVGIHGDLSLEGWTARPGEDHPDRITLVLTCRGRRCPLLMERELTLVSGEATLYWRETLTNLSPIRLPVLWGHHPSIGGPLIERGARLYAHCRRVQTPPAERPELSDVIPDADSPWPWVPLAGGGERDASLVPAVGTEGEHVVLLHDFVVGYGCVYSEQWRLGFGLRWDERLFPWAWSWIGSGGARQYPLFGMAHVVTIQPCTSPMLPLEHCIATGHVLWLEPGASRATALAAGAVATPDCILPLAPTGHRGDEAADANH